jgi:hypothetical protein
MSAWGFGEHGRREEWIIYTVRSGLMNCDCLRHSGYAKR